MDDDRKELVDIHQELDELVYRLKNANWHEKVTKPTVDKLIEASMLLHKARLEVEAVSR